MPHARKKNVHAKPLKPRAAPINTCVENDDWPRAKPGGRKRCLIRHEKAQNVQKRLKTFENVQKYSKIFKFWVETFENIRFF